VQHATAWRISCRSPTGRGTRQIPDVVAVAPEVWFGGTYKDDRPETSSASSRPIPTWAVTRDYTLPRTELKTWQAERDSFAAGKQLHRQVSLGIGTDPDKGSYHGPLDLVLRACTRAGRSEHFLPQQVPWRIRSAAEPDGIFFLRTKTPEQVPVVCGRHQPDVREQRGAGQGDARKQFSCSSPRYGNVSLVAASP